MDEGDELYRQFKDIVENNNNKQGTNFTIFQTLKNESHEIVTNLEQNYFKFHNEATSIQIQSGFQHEFNRQPYQPQEPQIVEEPNDNETKVEDQKQPNDDDNKEKKIMNKSPLGYYIPQKIDHFQPSFPAVHLSILPKGFISKQTYSYQNYELLEQILKSTEMKQYTIYKEQKVIEYNFDRKQFIKLSDLIYWILKGLVLIHVGQLLDLFENILEYINILELKNIYHEYLDSNRIWLFMDEDSKFPNVVPELMKYRIILTGYQCPFYEDCQQQQMKASDKIILILTGIIYSLISKNCWFVIHQENIDKVKSIYQKIINVQITIKSQTTQNFNIIQFIQLIKGIKQSYHYNNETQMLDFDLNSDCLKFRIVKSLTFSQEIKNLFISFKEQNQLYLENAFQELVPLYEAYLVQNVAIPQNSKQFQDQFKQKLENFLKQLHDQTKEFIQQQVLKEIENLQLLFKFVFTDQEIEEITNEIMIEYNKTKIKNYFENSIQFYNIIIQKNQFVFFEEIAKDLIQKRMKLSLENKILKMIIELI